MFHSIRWRLVFSYTALTLLTVTLVGLLTFRLIERYVVSQEIDSLTANAQAIARQAPLFMNNPPMLTQLVRTAAFLGNVEVKISDADGRPLADSGDSQAEQTLTWYVPPTATNMRRGPLPQASGVILFIPDYSRANELSGDFSIQPLEGVQTTLRYATITVERVPGIGGNRFHFNEEFNETYNAEPAAGSPASPLSVADKSATDYPAVFWRWIAGATEDVTASPAAARAVTVPIQQGTQVLGHVELSHSLDVTTASLLPIQRALATAGLGIGLLAVLVGLGVSQGLTSPIRTLRAAARRMGSGELSARANVRSSDEIGELAAQFNQMADRLQVSFDELEAERDALRQFIADASHELRTPITALKTFVELLQGPAASDPAAQAEFLDESQTQLTRLSWITSNLLDLSRLDSHLASLMIEDHEVSDVVDATLSSYRRAAQESGITIATDLPEESLLLACDRSRLELVLSNLLDNALKYTAAEGKVTVGADAVGNAVRIWVEDSGSGISAQDLPHVFQRFYRGKNSQTQTNGSGLGLAIVQSVIAAHGGQITVESTPGQGSRFQMVLPRYNESTE